MGKAPFSSRVGKDHRIYNASDRSVIPSVTEILDKEVPGKALARAAANLARRGVEFDLHWNWLGEIGTLTHSMIFHDLTGGEPDTRSFSYEQIDIAENCFLSFLSWKKDHDLEIISCETPMVSEVHHFGGTPDICGILDGIASIIDIKTGAEIYMNIWYQLAGYKILFEENNSIRIRKLCILNLGRDETEKLKEGYLPSRNHQTLDLHEMYFLQQLKAFKIEQKILARN